MRFSFIQLELRGSRSPVGELWLQSSLPDWQADTPPRCLTAEPPHASRAAGGCSVSARLVAGDGNGTIPHRTRTRQVCSLQRWRGSIS